MTTTQGIDLSHWNAVTDWSPTGLGFVVVKVSEGTTKDPLYEAHVAKAVKNLKVTGGYMFARNDVSIAAQAKFFVQHADARCTYLAVDNEGKHAMTRAQVIALIKAIRQYDPLHRRILLYMSASGFYQKAGQDYNWVAQWGGSGPSIPWLFWQYQSGSQAGSGGEDRDLYRGSVADLKLALQPIPVAPDSDAQPEAPMAYLPIADHTPRKIDLAAPATFYDLDGSVASTGHSAVQNLDSPFRAMNGTSTFYAAYARQADGTYDLILTKPSAVRDIPPTDCPPVQESAEFKALEDQLAAAQAATKTAAADEKARIAKASGDAEANRIKAI